MWRGQTQKEFAHLAKIKQGTLSDIESGKSAPSAALVEYVIDQCTPIVLFIHASDLSKTVASAMLQAGQIDILLDDPDSLSEHLKNGLKIGIICDNKQQFTQEINKHNDASGLPIIPCRGIKFDGWLGWVEWNDVD